jgi:hypothetical protein
MTKANDLAHPIHIQDNERRFSPEVHTGLTKREYFAAMAMQGYLASYDPKTIAEVNAVAKYSTRYADALIKALNETDA